MDRKPVIVVVEDEAAILTLLRFNLEKEGFVVAEAVDGDEALMVINETKPDLVLLDWMLPGRSGLEVCRQLRRKPDTANLPVIMLTARGEEADRVRGLDTGADDFIAKPFSPREVVARIRAVLRRTRPQLTAETLSRGGIVMDFATVRVTRDGRELHLGPTEFRLLRHLLEQAGRVFSREQLLDSVWGRDSAVELRTVDVHIRRLRVALNEGGGTDIIRTVRSAGYSLELSAPIE